jgi:pimeloyl-ACP methyl ester carboxylesterase
MTDPATTSAPIILVPGFWLGAWAWDEVAADLRADGHDVTALTLPGLESADADRSTITMSDHVEAITDAVQAALSPVVLAVHSATGFSGYAASDRVPDRIAAMVYVDTAPGKGALDPEFDGIEKPMVWKEIEAEENLDGLSEEQKETFRQRAVPVPGGVLREGAELTHDARAPECHLDRPADEPLADVVPAQGGGPDHRRRCKGARATSWMTFGHRDASGLQESG